MSLAPPRRAVLKRMAASTLVLTLVVVTLVIALRAPIRDYLHGMTGEENAWEQVKGFARLIVLRLSGPSLQLASDVPISHAGVNPFGINTFLEQEVDPAKVDQALRMIYDAGFRWIRQEFPWEDIEQSARGDYWDHKWSISAWDKYDRIVRLAREHGLGIIARLDNPPAWSRADGNARGTLVPPDDLADYGNFVHAVASRYKGQVRYYQVWNEPNIYPEWGEQPVDPEGYVELLKLAYRRAKEADPDCVILSAGLAQTTESGPANLSDLVFLQRMYDAGVKGHFDIMGVMSYGLWTGPGDHRASLNLTNFSRPLLIRDIMVRNGDADKALWATEIGWNALPDGFDAFPLYGRVDVWQQARYAVQAYQRAQEEWPWMGVMNYWFFKRATDLETDQVFYYFRMVEPDFTPLPVYEAIKSYANQPPDVYPGFHQEFHWALRWSGAWEPTEDSSAVLGGLQRTATSGDALQFTFVGTDCALVLHEAPDGGTVAVSIDGRPSGVIDLRRKDDRYGVQVPLATGLRDTAHTVEIRADCTGDAVVDIDGLIVRRRPFAQLPVTASVAAIFAVGGVWLVLRRRGLGATRATRPPRRGP